MNFGIHFCSGPAGTRLIKGQTETGPEGMRAFTRWELMASLACLTLLGGLALPILAMTQADSERATCFNNLRQLGRAVRQWAGNHAEEPPWLTLASQGGTRPDAGFKSGVAWAEYLVLSNELVDPRILVCPSDAGVKVASTWTGPDGLANPTYRQNAISYLIGLHANSARPQAFIATDYNIQLSSFGTSCGPAAVNTAASIIGTPTGPAMWTNAIHVIGGHYLSVDGTVRFLNTSELRTVLFADSASDNNNHHLLRTR